MLGSDWAFAEGRVGGTGNCQTYLLLGNPNATDATAVVTYVRAAGLPAVQQTYTVKAGSRLTVWTNAVQGLADETFGITVAATGATIAAERAMYWDAAGVQWAAGTATAGVQIIR